MLVIGLILGIASAAALGATVGILLADYRERTRFQAALLGALLGPIGWLLELLAEDHRGTCTECFGRVWTEARRCRHCGVEFPTIAARPEPARSRGPSLPV